jgi:hypothetical protein
MAAIFKRPEDVTMKATALAKTGKAKTSPNVGKLSTAEILSGILLFVDDPFPEQAVYRFFAELEANNKGLAGRFQVRGAPGNQSSEPLRQALSFLEMGKVLELPQPNPVDQYYRIRRSQIDSLRANLKGRGVLPRSEALLNQLAKVFRQSSANT